MLKLIEFVEQNKDKIVWCWLSRNPNAIHLLEKNQDKIFWNSLSENMSIFELDYSALRSRCNIYKKELIQISRFNIYKEELIQIALRPSRIEYWLNEGFEDF